MYNEFLRRSFMANYDVSIQTKNKILKATKYLFYKNGSRKTSLQDIADLADVNKRSILYHFKNKAELSKIIFKEMVERNFELSEIHTPHGCDFMTKYFFVNFYIPGAFIISNQQYRQFCMDVYSGCIVNSFTDYLELFKTNVVINPNHFKNKFHEQMALQGEIGLGISLLKCLNENSSISNFNEYVWFNIEVTLFLYGMKIDRYRKFIHQAEELYNQFDFIVGDSFEVNMKKKNKQST